MIVSIKTAVRIKLGLVAATTVVLSGCGESYTDFPVARDEAQARANEVLPNVNVVLVTPATIPFGDDRAEIPTYPALPYVSWEYRVGVGDALKVVLWEEPQPLAQPDQKTNEGSLYRVQSNGSFFYPFVGRVDAAGKTPEEVRANLTERLQSIIQNPQIQVEVAEYRSQSVSVTGDVRNPGNIFLGDAPTRVLDAISAAGGFAEEGDQRQVLIRRGGRIYGANIRNFLTSGQSGGNAILLSGDVVSVGRKPVRQAFILGSFADPLPVPLGDEEVSLTQAISSAGGLTDSSADARGVFVFRETPGGFTVFQLDVSNPASLVLGTRFPLRSRDVIYATTAPLHRWNRVVSGILPTISVVTAANDITTN
ncbi:MAG: polysaccharide biosynthesis/export family protein [Erythrobacter sp.]